MELIGRFGDGATKRWGDEAMGRQSAFRCGIFVAINEGKQNRPRNCAKQSIGHLSDEMKNDVKM